jgi:hypothetical protein
MCVREDAKKNNQLISDAIDALGINVPITRVRVVGNRVEIWTYGSGDMKVWEGAADLDLGGLLVKDLRELAKEAGIEGASRLTKDKLKAKLVEKAKKDKKLKAKLVRKGKKPKQDK